MKIDAIARGFLYGINVDCIVKRRGREGARKIDDVASKKREHYATLLLAMHKP